MFNKMVEKLNYMIKWVGYYKEDNMTKQNNNKQKQKIKRKMRKVIRQSEYMDKKYVENRMNQLKKELDNL